MIEGVSEIEYPFDEIPEIGAPLEVAHGIFWVRMPMPPPLLAINVYLLRDSDGWAIVDTGLGDEKTQSVWDRLLATVLRDAPVTRIIITHHHPDHAGNAGWLCQRLRVPLYASLLEFRELHGCEWAARADLDERIAALRRSGVPESLIDWRRALAMRKYVAAPPAEYRRMADQDRLLIDGAPWQVLVGYGHTPEHVSLYSPERRILIAGDQLLPRINALLDTWDGLPADDLLQKRLDSFAPIEQLPDDTLVFPSHDEPFLGAQVRVRQIRERHDMMIGQIEELCARRPLSIFELAEAMTPAAAPMFSQYLACGNAYAHVKNLEAAGRISLSASADGIERWRSSE